MHSKNRSTVGANSGSSSSMSLNIGGILSNALIQPLTQTKMKSNLTFTQSNTAQAKYANSESKDRREQYYYEEEYDDEVIDLESRAKADPPIRKVRTVQNPYQTEEVVKAVNGGSSSSDGAENQIDPSDSNSDFQEQEQRRRNNSAVDRWGVRLSQKEAQNSTRRNTEKNESKKAEVYIDTVVYDGDPPEIKKQDFSEAILMEWRERNDELNKQNEQISDKDDHSRYEHPSITKFQKTTPKLDRSVISMQMSFAGDSSSQRESLLSIRKRFTEDESVEVESNLNSSPQASREYLVQLKPFRSKYKHLFATESQMSDVSKVEIEFVLRKQLQKGLCGDDELNFDETNENSFTMDDRDDHSQNGEKHHGKDELLEGEGEGEMQTPLLLDKLTSRLSHYYQLNQLLAKTLKHRCHEQSNKFDAGMNRITNVLQGVNQLKEATQNQKQRLRKFKEQMAAQILRVNLMRLKQKRLKEIQQLMQKVIGKYSVHVLQQVYAHINAGEFISALDLIHKSRQEIHSDFQEAMPDMAADQIHQITVVNLVLTRLSQAEDCIWKILSNSLQSFCLGHPFSSQQYSQIFQCYCEYGCENGDWSATAVRDREEKNLYNEVGLKNYCEMLQQKFEDGLNRTVQVLAHRIIVGGNPYGGDEQMMVGYGKSEEQENGKSNDDLIYSVRDCYIAICRVLYNHHLIVRWHHSADISSDQKQWLFNQLLHTQRPALVTLVDNLVTISVISPLRQKICQRDLDNNQDGMMPLQKLIKFLALTGLLAKILMETSHQDKLLKIIEATQNQILKTYVEKMQSQMIEDFREVLECVEAFERMPIKEGFDIWGKDKDDLMLTVARKDLLEVFTGSIPQKQNSSLLAQFVHKNPFIEAMPNKKQPGQTISQKQQAKICLQNLQKLIRPVDSIDSIHDEYSFLKLGLAQLNSRNLMKLDQLQNQNQQFYSIDEDEFDNSDQGSNDSDCLDSSEDEDQKGTQMIHQSASSRPSAPYQTLSKVFGSSKRSASEQRDWSADDVIISISGLSLIRTILLRHLSMMRSLRSHTFEIFVSYSECLRFYGHVISSVFIHSHTYYQIVNDIVIYGAAYSQQAKQSGMFTITDREKSRVCRLVHFQSRYAHVKTYIEQGQNWVESSRKSPAGASNDARAHRKSLSSRQPLNTQNLNQALGQNGESCELGQVQKQINDIFYRSATDFVPPEVNRIQLFLKQVVALEQLKLIQKLMNSGMPSPALNTQQSQVFDLQHQDSNEQNTLQIKETIKDLLAPNTQQVTYLLNFYENQQQFNDNLRELLTRQALKMLLFPQINKEQSKVETDQRSRKSMDSDKALESQFAQIGQNIMNIIGNVPHSHKWSGVERRTEPSGYVNKLLEQIKDFEYKMQKLCQIHQLPQIGILMDNLWQLWDMIACDLIEQYSQISSVDAAGRQNMISDVDYLLKLCHNIFRTWSTPAEQQSTKSTDKSKKKQEQLIVPPMMLALKEYLQAYFLDLKKLLAYSKKNIQTCITYEQLKRIYKVHPSMQPDQKPTSQPQVKKSFFKKLTQKSSSEVQPKDVQEFFKNVELFFEDFFRQGIRQEDLNDHPGASLQSTVIISGLMS